MAPVDNIQTFFESGDFSEVNQRIILKYFDSMVNKRLSEATIDHNINIARFLLTHIRMDLDKLTIDDINEFQTAVTTWTRKNGTAVADSTKKQYIIGFKRFLHLYGKRYGKRDYLDLADNTEMNGKAKRKLPSDLLTQEELFGMIGVAEGVQNKAMIAVLAESGCRVGELKNVELWILILQVMGVN